MQNIKSTVIDLAQKNILLSDEKKQKILRGIDGFSDTQLDALEFLLSNAHKKQGMYLERVVRKHPDFSEYLESFVNKKLVNTKKTKQKDVGLKSSSRLKKLWNKIKTK